MMFHINFAAFQRIREKISTVSLEGAPIHHNILYFEDDSFFYLYLPYDGLVYYAKIEKLEIDGLEIKQTLDDIIKYAELLEALPDRQEVALKISAG